MKNIQSRLARLYEVVEAAYLQLADVAPPIREYRSRLEELGKMRVQAEAEIVARAVETADTETVKRYAQDLLKSQKSPRGPSSGHS